MTQYQLLKQHGAVCRGKTQLKKSQFVIFGNILNNPEEKLLLAQKEFNKEYDEL